MMSSRLTDLLRDQAVLLHQKTAPVVDDRCCFRFTLRGMITLILLLML